MVEMKDVKVVYQSSDTVALDGISMRIDDGEFVFLVGPSGSGKSTIMKLITGEIRADAGKITINDFNMRKIKRRKLPKVRRTLGAIFQDYRLIENMNVYDNVAFAMRVVSAPNRVIRKRVPYVLELVGLDGREKRMPNELSGGEQQRVAIARALVNNPRMIIADEPTGNLDPVRSLELMLLFEKINKEMGTTIMVVTHEKELVNALEKRVITIENGRVASDETDVCLFDPRRFPQYFHPRIYVLRLGHDYYGLSDYYGQRLPFDLEHRRDDQKSGGSERGRCLCG